MRNMAPEISIALCTCNGEAYLSEQLDSILAQSFADFELVVYDDASSDGTIAILGEYARVDPRIKVHRNPVRVGLSQNYARAIAACLGRYIAPSDQDDVWLPDKLERLHAAIGEADLAYCDSEFVDSRDAALGFRMSSLRGMYAGSDPLALTLTNSVSGHALLVDGELARRSMPVPDGLYYDWWLAIVAANRRGIRYLDAPLVRFRRHGTTVTTLGGVRSEAHATIKDYWAQKLGILQAIASLGGARGHDARLLAEALVRWLAGGSGVPFLGRGLLRMRSALSIFMKRPGVLVRGLRRHLFRAVGRGGLRQ